MSLQLSDEPLNVLAALQSTIANLKCNKQSRVYFDSMNEQLSELQAQLSSSIESMKEEAAYGQTLKQNQLKGLQVRLSYQSAVTKSRKPRVACVEGLARAPSS